MSQQSAEPGNNSSMPEDSDAAQRKLIFDPVRLVDGIELSNPLPTARSAIYGIAYKHRNP
jgi:hypothetical protein